MAAKITQDLVSLLDSSTKLVTSDSPDYQAAIQRWSDTAIRRASVVAYPLNAQEVSKIVRYAAQNKVDLAVKCGGHATGGNSSSDGGIVIDLSKMRKVAIVRETQTITAEGGCVWHDINKVADENRLVVMSSTVSGVGVGGSTLGGGFGWLCGEYGTMVDNLLAATIVLANGDIVAASKRENPDLFWAIRGAGPSFGVVVEFQFQAYPPKVSRVFAGRVIFKPDQLDAIVEAINHITWSPNPRAASHYIMSKPHDGEPRITVNLFYNGDEKTARNHFASILKLPSVASDLTNMPYIEVTNLMADVHKGRKSLKGVAFSPPVRPEFIRCLWDEFIGKITQEPELVHSSFSIESYDMTKIASVPLEEMAFPTRGLFQMGIIKLSWTDPNRDEEFRSWGRYLQHKCRKEAETMVAQPQAQAVLDYANYSEPDDAYYKSPFGPNQKKLEQLKAKYDPDNLFNHSNPISLPPR